MSHTILKILLLASITLSCGDLPQKDETSNYVTFTWDTMTYATVTKEHSVLNSFESNLIVGEDTLTQRTEKDFIIPPLEELLESQKFTSGTWNPMEGLNFENDKEYDFGKYHLYSESVGNSIADIYVRYKTLPWRANDPEQEVLAIIINHKSYNLTGLEIQVGQDGEFTRSIYPSAERVGLGYQVNLKSSIIKSFVPFNNISSIQIIRKEGLKNLEKEIN